MSSIKDTSDRVREKAKELREDIRSTMRSLRPQPIVNRRRRGGGVVRGMVDGNLDERPKILDRFRARITEVRGRREEK